MQTHVRCGTVFTGGSTSEALADHTICFDERGEITHVGPTSEAPPAASDDAVLDYSRLFVMPGLQDVHTHLAYGNAKSEEDIDLYQPMEFRALRGLFFAQKVLAAGYTAICAPGDAGQISLSVRNSINFGLFDGPRVTAAGRYITSRQGLTDWYPTWIGAPDTSIGRLVTSRDEAIEEIRVQVKNGVDCIKIAMDGTQTRESGELIAAFNQEETSAMVQEAHRLGRRVVVHARGREAVLYSARAGVDLIFHAYYLDDECIEAMVKSGSAIGPTMTFPRNIIDFTQPHEPAAIKGRPADVEREYAIGCENLRKAKRAGVLMLTGTDSGFAVTPYGEWHATEPEIFVRDLGFSPAEALICATAVTSRFIANGSRFGVLEQGRFADFIAVDGSPLDDITLLQASGASAMCISQGSGCTSRHEATTHARSPTEASATGPTSTRRSVSGRSDRAGSVSPRGRIANRSARRSQRYDCVDASDPARLIPSLALVRHRQSHHGRSAASPRSPTSPDVARGARR